MRKSTTLQKRTAGKQEITIDVFAGIDRSTSRFRIEGDGQRLYEATNVFPYIQGLLKRRKDAVQTNSRDSDNAFPTFPALSLVGNAVIKKLVEFNNTICFVYEDDGDQGKVLVDSFDTGANTLTNRVSKTSNGGSAYTFTAGGRMDAVAYNTSNSTPNDVMFVDTEGTTQIIYIRSDWTIQQVTPAHTASDGVCDVFLQAFFSAQKTVTGRMGRTSAANTNVASVQYTLAEAPGRILRLMSFGYQTASAGATSVFIIFKQSSIWVMTGIGTTESMDQITGNIGLVGRDAVTYTPLGLCFAGRDTDGLINLYLLDRNSLVLHTIGHELYEELNDIPKASYGEVLLSYHRNRMIRIAMTKTGDSVNNNQEYWMDFYNGYKKRTLWGPNFLPASNTLKHAISFSGGIDPEDSGFFMILEEGSSLKIYEEINTDSYNSTDSEWDDQIWRTKMFDFGRFYGIVMCIKIVALDNAAKFKVSYEVPKDAGDDNDTTITEIGSGYQMGSTGRYLTKPIRMVPPLLVNQIGFKIESDYDGTDNKPFEPSMIVIEYEMTGREVIE